MQRITSLRSLTFFNLLKSPFEHKLLVNLFSRPLVICAKLAQRDPGRDGSKSNDDDTNIETAGIKRCKKLSNLINQELDDLDKDKSKIFTIPPSQQADSSVEKLMKAELSYLWNTTPFNSELKPSDRAVLEKLRGLRSIIILRELYVSFVVAVHKLVAPFEIEIGQSTWSEKFKSWSENYQDYGDLGQFSFLKILDRELKIEKFHSSIRKKGIADVDDFLKMYNFAETWRSVSSFKSHPLATYYLHEEAMDSDINSDATHHKDNSEVTSIEINHVSSELMMCNSKKIADYFSCIKL